MKNKKDAGYLAVLFLFFLGAFIVLVQCKKTSSPSSPNGNPSSPGNNEVWIQGSAFNPTVINISVNTTVKWTNKDGMAHTVTSTTGLFDSGTISAGGTYSHTFSTAGTYPYKCTIHSNMNGTVNVQ